MGPPISNESQGHNKLHLVGEHARVVSDSDSSLFVGVGYTWDLDQLPPGSLVDRVGSALGKARRP
jgi:hypothetical protein